MASNSTGDLFIRIGMNLDAVDQGLVYLNKTVEENVKVIEEKVKQHQLKLDIDASGLDSKLKTTIKNLQDASNNSTGNVLIKAGIDLSEVNKGLVNFNKTVDENVKLAEQKLQQRKLKLNADTSKIDSTTSQGTQEYFKTQYHGLRDIEEIQKQIVKLREAEYQAAVKTAGVDSKDAQKALTARMKAEEKVAKTQQQIKDETGYLNANKISELEKYHQKKSFEDSITQGRSTYKSNNQWLSGNGNVQENAALKETTEHLKNQYHELKSIEKLQQQIITLKEADYKAAVKSSGIDSKKAQEALTAKNAVEKQMAATQKNIKVTEDYLKTLNKLDEAEKHHQAKSVQESIAQGRLATRARNRDYRSGQTSNQNISSNAEAQIQQITERFNVFNRLKDAKDIVKGVGTATVESFNKLPEILGRGGMAVAGFTAGLLAIPLAAGAANLAAKKLQDTVLELADSALKSGDALYSASRGAQMTVAEFAEFSRVCKVTGINLNEVTDMSKKMQAALVKVESGMTGTGAASAKYLINNLKRYGVELRQANGELKNSYEIFKELSAGLQRAQEQGRGKEFLVSIGATGAYATALEDLAGNIELSKKLVKNKSFDATLAHNTQGLENAMNTQKENLEGAFSSIFVPVAHDMIPEITEQLGRLTNVLNENAGAIKTIAGAAANAAIAVTDFGVSLVEAGGDAFKWVTDKLGINDNAEKEFIAQAKEMFSKKLLDVSTEEDFAKLIASQNSKLEKEYEDYESGAALKAKENALEAEREKLAAQIEQLKKEAEEKLNNIGEAKNFSDAFKRQEIRDQLRNDINEVTKQSHFAEQKINGTFNLLEQRVKRIKSLAKIDLPALLRWKDSDDAKALANEGKTPEVSLTPAEQNAHEMRMSKLQDELQKLQLEARFGANTYAKTIEELNIQREKQLKAAEALKAAHPKEYEEEVALIYQKYSAELEKLKKSKNAEIKKITDETANIEFERTHTAFEKQLRDIEQWKKAQLEKANTAKEVSAIIANAAAKETKAFEDEVNRIRGKVESLAEKVLNQETDERYQQLYNLQKEIMGYVNEGIYPPDLIQRYANNALKNIAPDIGTVDLRFNDEGKPVLQIPDEMYDTYDRMQKYLDTVSSMQENFLKSQAEDIGKNIDTSKIAMDKVNQVLNDGSNSFKSAMLNSSDAANNFSASLKNVTDKVNNLQFNAPKKANENFPVNYANDSNKSMKSLQPPKFDNKSLQPLQPPKIETPPTVNQIQTPNPATAEKVKAAAQKMAGNDSLPERNSDLSVSIQQLVSISETNLPQIVSALQPLSAIQSSLANFNIPDFSTAFAPLEKLSKLDELSNINSALAPLNQMTSELAALTQSIGSIAQDANNRQSSPPQLNINVGGISVDLGGAYVFDDRMKSTLTTDITNKVADAVKSAVEKGISSSNYSYG